MRLDLANYAGGREQAFVKHYFLDRYLERLIFKIASKYDEIVYIDGFSGPWQNRDEEFQDTSFGIALRTLTMVRKRMAELNPPHRRQIRVTAHLVERDPRAFSRLSGLQHLFPDVCVVCHHGEFTRIAPEIAQSIPSQAFSFVFVDPKGWNVDLRAIKTLVGRDNCEVVFNFMFDFINRFSLLGDPVIADQLDRLIPDRAWRTHLASVVSLETTDPRGDDRGKILLDEFKAALGSVGGYQFVADVQVLYPTKDRPLYFLVYGTRKPAGIEEFRNCQISAMLEQSQVRGRAKMKGLAAARSQGELLSSTNEMGPDPDIQRLERERERATKQLLEMIPNDGSSIRWGTIWPQILARYEIRRRDLNAIAVDQKGSGILTFEGWTNPRKKNPEDCYKVRRRAKVPEVERLL